MLRRLCQPECHGHGLHKFVAHVNHRNAIHRQNAFERLDGFALGEVRDRGQGDLRRRKIGRAENSAIDQLGVNLQELVERNVRKIDFAGVEDGLRRVGRWTRHRRREYSTAGTPRSCGSPGGAANGGAVATGVGAGAEITACGAGSGVGPGTTVPGATSGTPVEGLVITHRIGRRVDDDRIIGSVDDNDRVAGIQDRYRRSCSSRRGHFTPPGRLRRVQSWCSGVAGAAFDVAALVAGEFVSVVQRIEQDGVAAGRVGVVRAGR